MPSSERPRFRPERFGAIIASDEPPILAHVDKEFARSLGIPPSPLWDEPPRVALSAPTEAHLTLTRRCPLSCDHCYTDSGPELSDGLDTEAMKARLDALAELRVFHVAMGGGEALLRDDLIELAAHARARGITPNLTTSGALLTQRLAAQCAELFGQINLSVDSVKTGARVFGEDKTSPALRALPMLRAAGARVGFNVVMARETFPQLGSIVAVAAEHGVVDMELLRFKPAGRGRAEYLSRRMTPDQRLALLPRALELSEEHGVPIKLDCSSTPFVCCHEPDPERLRAFDVLGCIGGISLLGIDDQGRTGACSFYPHEETDVLELSQTWEQADAYPEFRDYPAKALEPCASCRYLEICRGGCRAVARFLTGNPWAPDPECPQVAAYHGGEV